MQEIQRLLAGCLFFTPLTAAQDLLPRTDQLWEGIVSPSQAAVGDFDGDGINDVIVVALASNTHVLRGLGDGKFDRPRPLPFVGGTPRAVLVADPDADGRPDLYVRYRENSLHTKVALLRNLGDFQFQPIPVGSIPVTSGAKWWESADMNGDGFGDLVLSAEGGSFSGGASGTGLFIWSFDGSAFDPTPLTVRTGPTSRFRTEDLVGDALPDLLFRSVPDGLWRVAENLGAGVFGAPTFPFSPTLESLPLLDLADLDGDGDLDIYGIDEPAEQQIFVAESFGGLNLGAAVAVPMPFEPQPSLLRAQDMTGNGIDDLFIAPPLPFRDYLLESLGGLTFASPRRLSSAAAALALGDLTGGAARELVGIAGSSLVYAEANAPIDPEFFGPPQGMTRQMGYLLSFLTPDLDGDGDEDILLLGRDVGLQWLRNDGALRFSRPEIISLPDSTITLLGMEDLNGDGADDLIVRASPNSGIAVRLRQGAFDFAPPVTISSVSFSIPVRALATNLNSDGDTDLIQVQTGGGVELFTLRNAGNGTLFPRTPIVRRTDHILAVAVLDANGDGFDDIVSFAASEVKLRLGLGDGSFGPDTLLDPNLQISSWAGAEDFDLDGDLDVLMVRAGDGQLLWAENLANGTLGPFQGTGMIDPALNFHGVEALDINVDGLIDIIINRSFGESHRDVLALGQAGGGFGSRQLVGETVTSWEETRFADFDGDGDLDALSFTSNGLGLHENTSRGSAGEPPILCEFGATNSAGLQGQLAAYGTPSVTSSDLVLQAFRLPQNQFGIFAGSRTPSAPTAVAGSLGSLCLAGTIGRYDATPQVQSSGASGSFSIPLDPTVLETSTGQVPAVAGETWFFQAWHRDLTQGGAPTSNFTGALQITFTP